MLRVLSLGAGVQSSTLALMYSVGYMKPKPHAAIFADTGDEPRAVYEWLSWLEPRLAFPVYRVKKARRTTLRESALKVRTARSGGTYIETAIPAYFLGEKDGKVKKGRGKRHCTAEFKIKVVTAKARELVGYRSVPASSGVLAKMIIGISYDEWHRVSANPNHWIENVHPLVDKKITRDDCLRWVRDRFGVTPPRSACVYCPFRSDASWKSLTPDEFAGAVAFERRLQRAYARAGFAGVPYLHSSRVRLDRVEFASVDPIADGLASECKGMCGV